ncbi:MAG: hypothetical protein EBX90_14365, partial [Betaproteobacteria bacterium]|nr:hypothetical protein [Betaproteobacteria bacterium]
TRVNAGEISIGHNTALGTGTVNLAATGVGLNAVANNLTVANAFQLNGANNFINTGTNRMTSTGTISGTGRLDKNGAGTLVLAGSNSFSGGTFLNAGTLSFGDDDALGTGNLTTANAALQSTANLTITNRVIINSSVTGTFDYGTNTVTNAGVISGAGSFIKTGNGSLSLTASNTFTGTMQINEGKVDFGTNGRVTPSTIFLGYNTNDRGIMTVRDGNTLTISSSKGVVIGFNGSGAVYQSGGTINVTGGTAWDNFVLGHNDGSYGYYNLSGGNVILKEVGVGSAGGNGTGMLDVTGGSLTADDYFFLTRGNASQRAVMNITGGAVYGSDMNLVMDPGFSFNNSSGKFSAVTVSSNGLFSFKNNGFDMNRQGTGNVGVINLNNGGIMESRMIYAGATGSSTYLNFNGGVIKSTVGGSNIVS